MYVSIPYPSPVYTMHSFITDGLQIGTYRLIYTFLRFPLDYVLRQFRSCLRCSGTTLGCLSLTTIISGVSMVGIVGKTGVTVRNVRDTRHEPIVGEGQRMIREL